MSYLEFATANGLGSSGFAAKVKMAFPWDPTAKTALYMHVIVGLGYT